MKPKFSLLALLCGLLAFAQPSDPWPPTALISPETLAAQLKTPSTPRIFYVGFPILYKGAHISKAIFAGPDSKPEGLDLLAQVTKDLPHDAEIILYCGCCPFVKCPNIRPAFTALHAAGFTNIKVLHLETNLHTDWIAKGYPTDK